jgi:hypothetical protein
MQWDGTYSTAQLSVPVTPPSQTHVGTGGFASPSRDGFALVKTQEVFCPCACTQRGALRTVTDPATNPDEAKLPVATFFRPTAQEGLQPFTYIRNGEFCVVRGVNPHRFSHANVETPRQNR